MIQFSKKTSLSMMYLRT